MKITGEDLAKLTQYLPGLKMFVKLTPTTIDDAIVKVLETLAGNQEMLDMLANWLSWIPMFEGAIEGGFDKQPELPASVRQYRPQLDAWRAHIVAS